MAAKKGPAKKSPARKASAKKAPAKKAAAKKVPAKKAAAKKAPARKAAVKQAPAKKAAVSRPAGNKTTENDASVEAYLAAIRDPARRNDCTALCALMARATGHPPRMWGPAIVGFGSYHFRYDSGREGDFLLVGFSSRASEIALYGLRAAPEAATLLAQLGRHKEAKGCIYLKTMADADQGVLARLVTTAAAAKQAASVAP